MIYDEGFEFFFEGKGRKYSSFFVFSKYAEKTNSMSNVKSRWASFCYTTLIGWYHIGDKWGCFKGTKEGHTEDEVTNGEAENKQDVVEGSMKKKESEYEKSFLQRQQKFITPQYIYPQNEARFMESKFQNKLQLSNTFKDHAKVVDRINTENLSWKAKNYEEFENLTIEEMNKFAGNKKNKDGNYFDIHFGTNKEKELNSENSYSYNNESGSGLESNMRKRDKKNSECDLETIRSRKIEKYEDLPKNFVCWKKFMGSPKSQVII
jgi:hypothetical protein